MHFLVLVEAALRELGDLRGGASLFDVPPECLGRQLADLGFDHASALCEPFVDDVGGPADGVGAESDGLRELAGSPQAPDRCSCNWSSRSATRRIWRSGRVIADMGSLRRESWSFGRGSLDKRDKQDPPWLRKTESVQTRAGS